MTIQEIQSKFEGEIKEATGAAVEVTFTDSESFSLIAESRNDLSKAESLIAKLGATLQGTDEMDGLHAAYYRF